MQNLATSDDVTKILRRPLTSEESSGIEEALATASTKFRRAADRPQGWDDTTTTVRLLPSQGRVRLAEPTTDPDAVICVTLEDGTTVDHTVSDQWIIGLAVPDTQFVVVTYTHHGAIPDDVRDTVAGMVARRLNAAPEAMAGVSSVSGTNGPFGDTYHYATWAQGGQILMTAEDLRIAHAYRPVTPRVWVGHT